MDKVTLPFTVSREFTFTLKEDSDVHITCHNKAIRKQQWKMHCIINTGKDTSRHTWVDLVSKGTDTRIKREEVVRYNESVNIFWQKKAWVDGHVMMKLARKFVREKV